MDPKNKDICELWGNNKSTGTSCCKRVVKKKCTKRDDIDHLWSIGLLDMAKVIRYTILAIIKW